MTALNGSLKNIGLGDETPNIRGLTKNRKMAQAHYGAKGNKAVDMVRRNVICQQDTNRTE